MTEILIQGLFLSGLYALIAVGFTLIFSIGRVLNLAYGSYLLIGGYTHFALTQMFGLPVIAGVLGAAAMGFATALLIYAFIVRPLRGDQVAIEIATLILAVVLQAGIVLLFGDASRILRAIVPGTTEIAGVPVTLNMVTIAILSWGILLALYAFIRRTHDGRAMLAVSMDMKGALISGVPAGRINAMTWGISGLLGAVAGVFFASYTQLSPGMWVAPLIIAIAVVIVGGIGSIIGTLVVAHLIGFMEVVSVTAIAPELRGVFTMLLIIAVLVLRPKGLFGREET